MEARFLAVRDLHKRFDETPILKGVSLDVEEGDLVSIIGPSGCGKSTFLRCMNFLEIPDAGRISIAGVTIDCQGFEDAPPKEPTFPFTVASVAAAEPGPLAVTSPVSAVR